MAERPRLKFFLDNCVPDSVARVLRDAGHQIILLRDVIPKDSPDRPVAAVSELYDAILVSHDKDFRALAPRIGIGQAAVPEIEPHRFSVQRAAGGATNGGRAIADRA